MLQEIHPKLPMRSKEITREFYVNRLGFEVFGKEDYKEYLMIRKDHIQIHFFEFKTIDPLENYGQVYIRTDHIDQWHQFAKSAKVRCSSPENKPWGQREFSIHDPDNNLLTFGQSV